MDRPRVTLAAVLAWPRWKWLLPALLAAAALLLLLLTTARQQSALAIQQQETVLQSMQGQLQDMTEAQQAQIRQQMLLFSSPLMIGVIGFATRLISMLLAWLFGAGLLYFAFVVSGSELKFPALLSAFSWTWLPFALRDGADALWAVFTGQVRTNPGLSYFVATGNMQTDSSNPLWALAAQIDLFWLWHVALIYALVKAVRPRGNALWVVLFYMVFYLAVRVGPALLTARLVGSL